MVKVEAQGARVGLQKIELTRLIQKMANLRLHDAHKLTTDITNEKRIVLEFSDEERAQEFIHQAKAIGIEDADIVAENNVKHDKGISPLMRASSKGYTDIINFHIREGEDINAKTNDGATALIYAAKNGHTKAVGFLLEHGANVNDQTKEGVTALMEAVGKGHLDIVKLLLEKGADVNTKCSGGVTALMEAVKAGYGHIVNLLREAGAKE